MHRWNGSCSSSPDTYSTADRPAVQTNLQMEVLQVRSLMFHAQVVQETAEAWHSLLEGMTELCTGLATAVAAGQEEDAALQGLFPATALVQLLGLCQSAPCRGLVMHIAAALTKFPAAVAVQAR